MARVHTNLSDEFFREIPKVDIHCHLYGTIRESTLKEFALGANAPIHPHEIEAYFVRGEKPRGVLHAFRFMEEFVLDSPDKLYRLTRECLEDLSAESVHYAELAWNSTGTLAHHPAMTFDEAQSAICSAMDDAANALEIETRLIHAIDRQTSPEQALEMVERALLCAHPRTVGIGIDYLETDHPPEGFWKAFRLAKEAGLRATAHAGEFGCHWRNIETAMTLLEVDRLDHCYTILDNPDLLGACIERGLVVTVVPTNSYYLRTLSPERWAEDHPIRRMAASGLKIHPNTDDPTFHNITPAGVWKTMYESFNSSIGDLRRLMLNGLDGAWLDDPTRHELKRRFEHEFDNALARYGSDAA